MGQMRGWAELVARPSKKYGYEYEMCRKDRRRNISEIKRKKKIKTWNDFLAIEKWKIDSKGF
jgi:hypothetical protein